MRLIFFTFIISIGLLTLSRMQSDYQSDAYEEVFSAPLSNPILLHAVAGFVPGLSADFQLLRIFSVLDVINKDGKMEYAPLIATYLTNASILDPMFFDTYRLASSILVYDLQLPEEGVQLLDYGSLALTDNWEIPFFGGYIAHEQLHDDVKAFELMSRVIKRPETPLLAIHLASRYLSSTQSEEDAIVFLQLLQATLPDKYKEGIEKKVAELQALNKEVH